MPEPYTAFTKYTRTRTLEPYYAFTKYTPALPQFYWNVKSAEQRIHHMCHELHKLAEYCNYLAENIDPYTEGLAELRQEFEQFKESGFEDYYEQQLHDWIVENAGELIDAEIKLVFFGLTQDGYFCAWIPEKWDEITFDTVADYSDPLYGRLVLLYDAEGNFDLNYSGGNYDSLSNKPSINGVTLAGNRTFEELGLQPITSEDIQEIVGS